LTQQTNTNTMKAIIFKSEKKAKVYQIISDKQQGCYGAGELMRVVKTDDIERLLENEQYRVTPKEVI